MNKIKSWHMHIMGIIVITVLCCINIKVTDYIYIINDEFGYWAHAISAAGYDWKDLISEAPYYSWGYSIWLIPIIMLLPTPELWYKAAIFLNIFFLIASYFLCYKSGTNLFREIDDKVIAAIACIVVIYPSNILYAQATWTETLSYLLVWTATYLIICLDEKYSNKDFIATLLVLVYAYAVHNKNIGIVLAGMISLCIVLAKYKKKFGYYLVMLLFLVAGYKGIDWVKNYQIQALWSNSKTSSMNNVSLNATTITTYSNKLFDHIGLFLSSLFGKYIYLLIGTGMTLLTVVIMFLRDTAMNIRGKSFWKSYEISKIWIMLAAASMYGICAIQVCDWKVRQDCAVYARYMETGFGPILFLAIMYCVLQVHELRIGLLIAAVSLVIGIAPVYYWITHADEYFNVVCSPVIGAFYQATGNMRYAFILLVIVLISAFTILFALTFCKRRVVATNLVIICFVLTYGVIGYYGGTFAADNRDTFDSWTVPFRAEISGDLEENEIFYIKNDVLDAMCNEPKYLQFLIPDRTIHVMTREELDTLSDEDIIVMVNTQDQEVIEYLEENMEIRELCNSGLLKAYIVD